MVLEQVFSKNYWNIFKKDLFNYVLEFFSNWMILKELNHTFIALINEIKNPV